MFAVALGEGSSRAPPAAAPSGSVIVDPAVAERLTGYETGESSPLGGQTCSVCIDATRTWRFERCP